jgi:hypothetical protein
MTIETTAAAADLVLAHPAFDYAAWEEERAQERAASRVELAMAKRELCATLKAAGVAIVVAEYYGDGDSGNTQEAISYCGNAATPLAGELQPPLDNTVISLSGELQSRLDDFVDRVISTNASGYENQDGGGGSVTINVAAQEIIMEHYDNVVEQVHQTFSL